MIKIGCCGWAFLRPKDFLGNGKSFQSILQAYAKIFDSVEINSTFYRIPKIATAKKWRKQTDEVNKEFEFTVKCSGLITHRIRFSGGSIKIFDMMKDVCEKLNASILLFQSPSSFKPSNDNIKRMDDFFKKIKRGKLILTWEPRGEWHKNPKLIKKVCKKYELVECVDPFRNDPLYFGKKKIAYFRLHGFGLISMYRYNFSRNELNQLKERIEGLKKKVKDFYVMFNNMTMYKNALEFSKILEK